MLEERQITQLDKKPALLGRAQNALFGFLSRTLGGVPVETTHSALVVGKGVRDVHQTIGWDGLPHSDLRDQVNIDA